MSNKAAYWLIIVGFILLLWNFGMINLSILIHPLSIPISFIIIGCIKLITSIVNLGDFGEIINGLAGFILFIIIILNIGNFISRFFVPTAWPNYKDSFFTKSESGFSAGFTDLELNISNNNALISYYTINNEIIYDILELNSNSEIYFNNSFGNYNIDLTNSIVENSSLEISNSFGNIEIVGINGFNTIILDSSFGNTVYNIGTVIGEKIILLDNSFGNSEIILDSNVDYLIESSNSFGSINNNKGLQSTNYETATNKIHLIIDNSFGVVTIR